MDVKSFWTPKNGHDYFMIIIKIIIILWVILLQTRFWLEIMLQAEQAYTLSYDKCTTGIMWATNHQFCLNLMFKIERNKKQTRKNVEPKGIKYLNI